MVNYAADIFKFIPRFKCETTSAKIERLCNSWCRAAQQANGGFAISHKTEKYRLLKNGINFTNLTHDELTTSLLYLSKVLLLPGLNTVIDADHCFLWAWCGEVLLSPGTEPPDVSKREIRQLFVTALHAALANSRKPTTCREEWELENARFAQLPHHSKELTHQSSLVLAYLGFPLLEAKLKEACSHYVSSDGSAITEFSVADKNGGTTLYSPTKGKRRISSLRDLLFLFQNSVASPQLKARLEQFRTHIQQFDLTQDPYDLIYEWRNQSLHGTTNFRTIGGTLLNLVLLIELFEIKEKFEERKNFYHSRIKFSNQTYRAPWSFYPPY